MTSVLAQLAVLVALDAPAPAIPAAAANAPANPSASEERPASAADFHGLLQLQYLSVIRNAQPSPAETGFVLRRARGSVEGFAYSPRLGYRAELEVALGALTPLDLYADWRPSPRWSIRVGQQRVLFSRNWTISEERLSFAERSIATEEFRYDYDIGVLGMAAFLEDRLTAAVGVFNGAGKNVVGNDNVDPLFLVRVAGTFGPAWRREEGDPERTRPPSLSIGGSATLDYVPEPDAYGFSSGTPVSPTLIVARDTNGNGRPDGVRVFQLEADLAFRWRGLAVDAEAYFRSEHWADIGALQPPAGQFIPKSRFGGAFAQVTYFALPARLEAGARVATAEISPLTVDGRRRPATQCADAGGMAFPCSLPWTDRRSELTFVAVGHWFGHGVQVVGMYTALRWGTSQSMPLAWSREQRFLLQTQLAF